MASVRGRPFIRSFIHSLVCLSVHHPLSSSLVSIFLCQVLLGGLGTQLTNVPALMHEKGRARTVVQSERKTVLTGSWPSQAPKARGREAPVCRSPSCRSCIFVFPVTFHVILRDAAGQPDWHWLGFGVRIAGLGLRSLLPV